MTESEITSNVFERIAKSVRDGLIILTRYPDCSIACEHDEIFCGPQNVSLITSEDSAKLEALGWSFREDSWRRGV